MYYIKLKTNSLLCKKQRKIKNQALFTNNGNKKEKKERKNL